MVDPRIMCRQHLLGEHLELHMFVGHLLRGKCVDGYVEKNLLETCSISSRHAALVAEMKRRGYKHRSVLSYRDSLLMGKIDRNASLQDLLYRCAECSKRYADLKESGEEL
jgi:hypothetical protein